MLINNQLMNLLNYSPDTHAKPIRNTSFGTVPSRMRAFGRGTHPNIRLDGLQVVNYPGLEESRGDLIDTLKEELARDLFT